MAHQNSERVPFVEAVNGDDIEEINGNGGNERPKEPWKGEFARSIVYSGLDAIITSFSLISSISAGNLSSVDVLVLGFANLVADGISMGFGDYVSSKSEKDVATRERLVTEWDVINQRNHQLQELLQQYQALGMDESDANTLCVTIRKVVSIFGKFKDILIDEKMVNEKATLPPDESEKPWKNGLVTFVSFLGFGCAPLLAFIVLHPFTQNDTLKFIVACVLSGFALALLGIARAKIAGQNYAFSAAITLLNGGIAGAAAYFLGWALRNIAGVED